MKKTRITKGSAGEKVCSGREPAEALGKTKLPQDEAKAWHRDLQAARKTFKTPVDKPQG
jgi:hypothetical protein